MIFSFRLLDKQTVTCPHSDSCSEVLQRGNLDDHLRYHCSGTLVACQFAGAGCEYRGPSKSMNKHQNECKFRKEGKRERKTLQCARKYRVIRLVEDNLLWTLKQKLRFRIGSFNCEGTFNLMSTNSFRDLMDHPVVIFVFRARREEGDIARKHKSSRLARGMHNAEDVEPIRIL